MKELFEEAARAREARRDPATGNHLARLARWNEAVNALAAAGVEEAIAWRDVPASTRGDAYDKLIADQRANDVVRKTLLARIEREVGRSLDASDLKW